MKREDVKSKIPGITDEQLDWLMGENGKDVNAANTRASTLQDQLDGVKAQLRTANDGLKAFEGVDVADLRGQIQKLQGDLQAKDEAHARELADRDFDAKLESAITGRRGRSVKAVRALLDIDRLKASKSQDADITAALDALAKDSGYLFESAETPPPYAAGTGTAPIHGSYDDRLWAAAGLQPKT